MKNEGMAEILAIFLMVAVGALFLFGVGYALLH